MIYFDNNATTKPFESILSEIETLSKKSLYGNPSSQHNSGYHSLDYINTAKESLLELTEAGEIDEVYFTSGGTESNNWLCHFLSNQSRPFFTTNLEHSSVRNYIDYHVKDVQYLTHKSGLIDLDFIKHHVHNSCIFVHWVNSETGIIQPIKEIANIAKKNNNILAVDAAQAVGKMYMSLESMDIDYLSFSAHKFHCIKGIGGIIVPERNTNKIQPYILGGKQQNEKRAGTENLWGIAALKAASQQRKNSLQAHIQHMSMIRDYFETLITQISDVYINGQNHPRVCNTSNVLFKNIDGLALLKYLDRHNICVSQGSACQSRNKSPSHVLSAIGLSDKDASSSLRFSFSYLNTKLEVDKCIQIIQQYKDMTDR